MQEVLEDERRERAVHAVALRSELANCVPFRAGEFGFTVDCVAQCENMLSIDLGQLDLATGPRGVLDSATLRSVVKAIGYAAVTVVP